MAEDRTVAVLFLDVDGTISPLAEQVTDPWGDQVMLPDAQFPNVLTSPTLLAALGALPAAIVWVSDWGNPTPTFPAHLFGRHEPFEHLTPADRYATDWWKAQAVLTWLEVHPDVRTVAWADDHLDRRDHTGCTRAQKVSATLTSQGRRVLTLTPAKAAGLTPAHLEQLQAFFTAAGRP